MDVSSVVRDTTEQTFTEFSGNENLSKKSLQTPARDPIFGAQAADAYHVSLSRQYRESDLVTGRNSSLGTSDCQGELSALFRCLKRVSAFAKSLCIAASLSKRIPHRSGGTLFSSRFRGLTSLIR